MKRPSFLKSKNHSDYKFKHFKFRGKTRTIVFEHQRDYSHLYFDIGFEIGFWHFSFEISFLFWGLHISFDDEEVH